MLRKPIYKYIFIYEIYLTILRNSSIQLVLVKLSNYIIHRLYHYILFIAYIGYYIMQLFVLRQKLS